MTIILNSRGSEYKVEDDQLADGAIEDAILDLERTDGGFGGTVWVKGAITLGEAIEPRNKVILDFLNSPVFLAEDAPFLAFQDCSKAQVKNARVYPAPGRTSLQTRPLLLFISADDSQAAPYFNRVDNIHFSSFGEDVPVHDGILFDNGSESGSPAMFGGSTYSARFNILSNLFFQDCRVGIRFLQGPFAERGDSANHFSNIRFFGQLLGMIQFPDVLENDVAERLPSYNLFTQVRASTSKGQTRFGVYDICGVANHFDHVSIQNWEAAAIPDCPDWLVSPLAKRTYICASRIYRLADCSLTTRIAGAPPDRILHRYCHDAPHPCTAL